MPFLTFLSIIKLSLKTSFVTFKVQFAETCTSACFTMMLQAEGSQSKSIGPNQKESVGERAQGRDEGPRGGAWPHLNVVAR